MIPYRRMLGDWINAFHLPPASFWAATPHEYLAACEANRRPAASGSKPQQKSRLSPEDVRRLKDGLERAKEAEARHREEQARLRKAPHGAHAG